MSLLLPILFLLTILIFPIITVHASTGYCNRSCGSNNVNYPFGFSAGCQIHLKCSTNGQMLIGEFPIQSVNSNNMKTIIEPKCNRSVKTLLQLYGENFAPTARNAILLYDCDSSPKTCKIPSTDVQTQFQSLKCDSNSSNVISNISCYSEGPGNFQYGFLAYKNVTGQHCRYLMSSISAEAFDHSGASLDIQVVELGWWIKGSCHCSKDANCDEFVSPHGRQVFRCHCKDGFEGDGYSAGSGCRKASSGCGPAKFISGHCGGSSRTAVLIGGTIAGVSLMVSLSLICCFFRRHCNSKSIKSTKRRLFRATGINIPIYPYKEILKATHGFSEKQRLGTGAYGTVYAGKLNNDIWVAIKRIKSRDSESIQQVMNEIKLLSTVSHPNLVRLLGCSIENGEQILVYEFMPNGTLCQHLHREIGDGLTWPVRLTIATETAQAIAHLHSSIDPPIYHRDVKSSNILLDFQFRSKVADFGLSRLGRTEISHISTAPQGTPGYLDPQYHQNFHLSDKSDVYSFGVVLIEIITAMKVVDFARPANEVNLAALATDRISKGRLEEIIDPFLEPNRDAWTFSSIQRVIELAFRCLAFHSDMRPSMTEVAAELEQISASSRLATCEDTTTNCTATSEVSSCSSSSNVNGMPLSLSAKKVVMEGSGLFMLQTGASNVESMERIKYNSPMSVQDPWSSEQSSPSSNSLLSNVIQ
ncbi:hypothetical protein LWI28_010863 [Acer negundo]|uniref:Protein kinase domain-containing protein n=1 Tax=Acer negundo TaxID=4023 RepID=A0AAD5P5M3_ACENE|nr:hypothetical protein LWI28_010863 [Acer negundo]